MRSKVCVASGEVAADQLHREGGLGLATLGTRLVHACLRRRIGRGDATAREEGPRRAHVGLPEGVVLYDGLERRHQAAWHLRVEPEQDLANRVEVDLDGRVDARGA